ncbi:MAG: hypothetical protein NTZ81_11150, partial [Actinobacteria bacterium]|nr:hypothetical protein [Actinomycetota bacterium]
MAGIAVLCEVQSGEVSRGSIGVLEEAGRLGAALGVSVDAIVCGSGLDDAKLAALGGFGASTVRVADDALLASGIAQPVVDSCATAQEAGDYRYW